MLKNVSSSFRISPSRIAAVAFTVFVLTVAWCTYVDYCVTPRIYEATARIQIDQLRDPASPNPMRSEIEFMSTPDVLAQIVTDLELDKVWAKRFKSVLDALPMEDSLAYLQSVLHLDQVPNTHVITITVCSQVPKEASDLANAVANRYKTVRDLAIDQLFLEKEQVLDNDIAQQKKVVAGLQGSSLVLGGMGMITAQPGGPSSQADVPAPLRAAQAQLELEQRALDDLQLRLRQEKTDHQLTRSPVEIMSLAYPPEYPSLPDHSFNLIIATILGFLLAPVAAALTELAFWYLARITPPSQPQPGLPPAAAPASVNY
jgi:uncharacterized protein involved in exopolysaccharide biosynthesis